MYFVLRRGRLLAAILCAVVLAGCHGYSRKTIEKPLPVEETEVEAPVPEPDPAPPPEAAPEPEPELPPDILAYESVEGDTLESVARDRLGHPILWRHLMEWNKRLEGPREALAPGTRLRIPLACRGIIGTTVFADPVPVAARPVEPEIKKPLAGLAVPRYEITPPAQVFQPGETLSFEVKWYFLTAGHASLSVESLGMHHGQWSYKFLSRARSKLLFFFKVNDWAESYCTEDELLSVRFEKHIREGKYSKDLVAIFDQENLAADWGGSVSPLSGNCRDILAAFYYFRTMPLPPMGEEASLCANNNGKNYEVVVKVLGKDRITVPAGEFDTIWIQPLLKFEGLFRQTGEIDIWLSDDARRMPVLLRSKVFLIGSVDVILTDYNLGGNGKPR